MPKIHQQNMSKQVINSSVKLQKVSDKIGIPVETEEFAEYLDNHDELSSFRKKFHYPKNCTIPDVDLNIANGDEDCIYLCGNSLGLCPKSAPSMIDQEMKKWQECGVIGHHVGKIPWISIGDDIIYQAAELVGAKSSEITIMNGLSTNLHFLMVSFYQPTPNRYKIMTEGGSFPSDFVAMKSQISFHNYDPAEALITISPREGEHTLRSEDIIQRINEEGDDVALILFSGVQFYTGQYFDIEAITVAGLGKGCRVGFDLAHAIGNVEMKLHDWNVDFASWCSYKYLNGGPGAIGGAFVHEKHAKDSSLKRFDGWWGVEVRKRFTMNNDNLPFITGAMAYAVSNPPVMSMLPVMASLDIFHSAGMQKLLNKQKLLTGFLEYLLYYHLDSSLFEILTPSNINERGCQLSISFSVNLDYVFTVIRRRGVICDMRRSRVLRVAPCPLYNKFSDVYKFVMYLKEALDETIRDDKSTAFLHTKESAE